MKRCKILSVLFLTVMLAGCKPYNRPEFVTIEASQTAFMIPLIGNTNDQASFESEEMLNNAKVATKEIQIPKRWVQTGRADWDGEWRPSAKMIIVERKPETREWTNDNTGTSTQNQGIEAESLESIGFSVGMNISAQIDEKDAAKFLYRYNNKPLAEIMDMEIRTRIEGLFISECAKRNMETILLEKADIMLAIENDILPYFKERGITITAFGFKGGFEYNNPEIQNAIDLKFKANQELIAQKDINERKVSEAKAEAEAKIIEAEGEAKAVKAVQEAIQSSPQYIEYIKWNKWDGKLPQVAGGDAIVDLMP